MVKPTAVINPASLGAWLKASGIMVSTSMARIPPADRARATAVTGVGNYWNTVKPRMEDKPVIIAITNHKINTLNAFHPSFFISAELDRPSGMLDKNTATMVAVLTPVPPIMVSPRAMDSGIPSITEPATIAAPLPSKSAGLWDRFRCLAPPPGQVKVGKSKYYRSY